MKPLISVVVPTYRRAELLDRCLAALAKQHLPGSAFEIIVVHDGPSARTQRVAAHWRRQLGPSGPAIRYRSPRHLGPAAARNAGWRIARAEIVAFTDDDTEPDPQWLSRALEGFCDVGVGAAWGRIVMPLSGEPTDYELDAAGLTRAEFATANCFCRTTALRAIGGFDERFEIAWREDSDLFFRLLEHGARVVHLTDAAVLHPIRRAPWGVSISQQKKIL
ncbi:MAG TPA: glycosyltransferase, partial [Gammaproteobacteria bacterium]|nr:glycosyltransferase [Gammaproteobacteria bacterium]